jgi:hypothetical protein
VVRRIFGPKREEVTGEWRSLHKEDLHDLCSSLNVIRMIRSERMRLAGRVACRGEKRSSYKLWWENLKKGNHLEHLGILGRIILKWILNRVG